MAYSGKTFGKVPLQRRISEESAKSSDEPALKLQELAGARSPSKAADSSDALACQLALKHRLMLSEVKHIIREFINCKHNERGGVDREDFDKVMAKIFDVEAVNDRVAAAAYRQTEAGKEIDIEKFLAWYVQNMFTQVNALNADSQKSASDALIYNLARKHGVSNFVVDKIKVKFDHFDSSKNGRIDFKEFKDMFCEILKCRDIGELNEKRIERFWTQVHKESPADGIDFTEFAEWYLKYFSSETDDEDFDTMGPLRKFYDSFDPAVQRRNSLRTISRISSMPGM